MLHQCAATQPDATMKERIDAALLCAHRILRGFEDCYFNALTPVAFWNPDDPDLERSVEEVRANLVAISERISGLQARLDTGSLAYPEPPTG